MPSRIAREQAARVDGLKPLAERARRNLDAGGNLETVMGMSSREAGKRLRMTS